MSITMPMLMQSSRWTLPDGADDQPILGNVHHPAGPARGVVVIAHGFKGYKDYGMFPRIAATLAGAGYVAHRFNFSHSGMTEDVSTFARAELFERDTWNRQVHDLRAVVGAIHAGMLTGQGMPLVLLGHSRGGVAVLLAAGRHGDELAPAGVVTAAAPATCLSMDDAARDALLAEGFLVSPSARTGQDLRVGAAFVQEQLDDPAGHDLLAQVGRIPCPLLAVHGDGDPTVPPESAAAIAEAARDGRPLLVEGGDHVFNVSNPMPADATASVQLEQMLDAVVGFVGEVC